MGEGEILSNTAVAAPAPPAPALIQTFSQREKAFFSSCLRPGRAFGLPRLFLASRSGLRPSTPLSCVPGLFVCVPVRPSAFLASWFRPGRAFGLPRLFLASRSGLRPSSPLSCVPVGPSAFLASWLRPFTHMPAPPPTRHPGGGRDPRGHRMRRPVRDDDFRHKAEGAAPIHHLTFNRFSVVPPGSSIVPAAPLEMLHNPPGPNTAGVTLLQKPQCRLPRLLFAFPPQDCSYIASPGSAKARRIHARNSRVNLSLTKSANIPPQGATASVPLILIAAQ